MSGSDSAVERPAAGSGHVGASGKRAGDASARGQDAGYRPSAAEGGGSSVVEARQSDVSAPCSCGHTHEHDPASPFSGPIDRSALISARGLTLRRGRRSVLEAVDIDLLPGEIVTLIGPNGAGKTTLVRLLLGLERAEQGEIHRRKDLRIGYVPQRFDIDHALPMTVMRFLSLGLDVSESQIAQTLADVGAGHVIDRQLARLSGGEGQRVVLARALLRQPNLLVLDEPVRGVDATGEAELYTLIGRLRTERGFGVLLVSHDLHVVMAASDRVLCLNRHVCCSGVPTDVARHPEYMRLFGKEVARAFAIYEHHHDHAHDLAGRPLPDAPGHAHAVSTDMTGTAEPSRGGNHDP